MTQYKVVETLDNNYKLVINAGLNKHVKLDQRYLV